MLLAIEQHEAGEGDQTLIAHLTISTRLPFSVLTICTVNCNLPLPNFSILDAKVALVAVRGSRSAKKERCAPRQAHHRTSKSGRAKAPLVRQREVRRAFDLQRAHRRGHEGRIARSERGGYCILRPRRSQDWSWAQCLHRILGQETGVWHVHVRPRLAAALCTDAGDVV